MSQPPAPGSSSKPPEATAASSNFKIIFEKALKEYKKKTRQDLIAHPLAAQLQACDSPAATLAILQEQVDQFNQSRSSDERLQRWLNPTINVLLAFTGTLGEGIGLVFSPAKVIFVGAGVLLQAAKDVEASQDLLIDLFERIENFFRRLEVYTTVPPTLAMTHMMVNIVIEVLDILGTATKEMKQSRAKKFLKKIAGITKLEDGLKKLDKMTNEEARMANAEVMRLAHGIDKKVEGVDEKVQGVGGQVKHVDEKVQGVNENVKVVEDKVQTVIDDGKETAAIIQKVTFDVDDVKRSQLRASLRQWQSPSDPSMNHNFASGRQYEGTAQWFCGGSKFDKWKVSGSLLWIHGKPGSGKSILCSAIINDIESLQKAGLASMAYFYFDFRDLRKQSHGDLLRSLLIQLSAHSDPFCDILSRLYDEYGKGARQPSDRALMHCLKEMLTLPNQSPVYLMFDALDECSNTSGIPSARELVLDFVKELVGMRLPGLRICATSRPEVNIRNALEGLAFFSVSLHDESGQKEDIDEYIKSVVHSSSDTVMNRWRDDDKDLVIQTLSERADGMFRWVFCQLEMLRHCLPQNVPHILSQLPATLDETYARVLKEIGKTNQFYSLRLLQCLTVARRPLRVEELAEILALDFGAEEGIPELKENWRWKDEQDAVLSTCSSLIVVVRDQNANRVVQFAHFSVQEFLTSDRLATSSPDISCFHILPEPAHTVIVKACLGILLRENGVSGAKVEDRSPLIGYAAPCWVDHARVEKVWKRVEDGIRRLFDPEKPHLDTWLSHSFLHHSRFFAGYNLNKHRGSPLYYASLCGFRDLAAQLISENPQDVTGQVGRNPTPLVAALSGGYLDIAELLFKAGADLGLRNSNDMTLMHVASRDGLADVTKWLCVHGVSANSQQDNHGTPLHLASRGGNLGVVRELLIRGADVNAQDRSHRTPLHLVSNVQYHGHGDPDWPGKVSQIVRLLIEHGADVTALDITHSTPLHLASFSGIPEIVQILTKHGSDVNAQNETHSTPLHRASLLGSAESVQLLINHGADITAQDWNHMTPLHLASSWDGDFSDSRHKPDAKAETVRLLIDHGADVTAQDKTHSTPLHMTLSFQSAKSVWLLIEHGADVNAQNETHLTPLLLVSSWDDMDYTGLKPERSVAKAETVRVLIEHGADVNAKDESHSTALHLASSKGSYETVGLLIEHGADVAAKDRSDRTPLHLASSQDNSIVDSANINAKLETVRQLIKHGADLSAQDKTHSTPLHLAAFSGSSDIVRLLLEHGADATVLDGRQRTLLHLASSSFHGVRPSENVEIVRLLIEYGMAVTAKDESLSTPLHLASSSGMFEIVRLLIESGADVTDMDVSSRTPLHVASSLDEDYRPYLESNMKAAIVRLLIEHGADVAAHDETRSMPLHLAAYYGSTETMQLLIEHGADVTAQDRSNRTPLHLALSKTDHGTIRGKAQTVRLLIEHGANVKAQDENHTTPLHLASFLGISEIVQLLIECGADITAQDQTHRTPLHMASSWDDRIDIHYYTTLRKTEAVGLLIDHGADVTAQDETKSMPLHLASSMGSTGTVRLLIEHGADVTAQDVHRKTPLHLVSSLDGFNGEWDLEMSEYTADIEKADIVQLLIRHGADVTARDGTHSTPLHLASSKRSAVAVDILIQHGSDVNAKDVNQSTPLHLAASSHLALEGTIVRLLLRHGANVDARDREGRTPLEIASSEGNSWIAKLLSEHRTSRG